MHEPEPQCPQCKTFLGLSYVRTNAVPNKYLKSRTYSCERCGEFAIWDTASTMQQLRAAEGWTDSLAKLIGPEPEPAARSRECRDDICVCGARRGEHLLFDYSCPETRCPHFIRPMIDPSSL